MNHHFFLKTIKEFLLTDIIIIIMDVCGFRENHNVFNGEGILGVFFVLPKQ
jgi:hypothetical protein